jgi:hypothetical protein
MPDWWVQNDIYELHVEYLAKHGGVRPGENPDSQHQNLPIERVKQWQDCWGELGIFKAARASQ